MAYAKQPRESGYHHGEAFMLMWYECKDCHHSEQIWNSRDGVTPFGMKCPQCNGSQMLHQNWGSDVFAPQHQLKPGQRFWRNGTPDEAEAIMRRRIEAMRGRYPLTPEGEAELIKRCRDGSESEFQVGWPMISMNPARGSSGNRRAPAAATIDRQKETKNE